MDGRMKELVANTYCGIKLNYVITDILVKSTNTDSKYLNVI